MIYKKKILANCMFQTGLFRLLRFRSKSSLIVVCYHRIRDIDHRKTVFDDSVFGPDQEEFSKQVKWLKNNNDILTEGELLSIVNGEYAPPRRSVVITFDDGYIDNYTLAYPVLKSLNVPAIFFIPTQAIEERDLGWWDVISYLIKSSKKNEIKFFGERFYHRRSYDKAVHFVLSLIYQNNHETLPLLDKLSEACGVELPDTDMQSKELMTWEQLRELTQNNITIGSHTHSHTIMSGLDLVKQKFELESSKRKLEEHLGINVRSISYPVGNYLNFTDSTKKIAAEVGYDLGFSFLTGVNSYDAIDPMDVKRIVVPSDFPHFVSTFELPEIFCDRHDSILDAGGLYK